MQDLPNENEEVVEAAISQCRSNRRLTFAFTQRMTLHMRVSRVAVGRGGSIANRNDFVGAGLQETLPVQHDLEATEVNAFENHIVRRHRNHMPLHVHADLVELRAERFQIAEDVTDCWLRSDKRSSHRSFGDSKSV